MSKVATAVAAFVLAAVLGACTAEVSELGQAVLEDASGVRVAARNASADHSVTTAGALIVDEGDIIVISPLTQSGSFHLTITPQSGGNAIYDEDVAGKTLFAVAADPGTYDVTTRGNGVTGEMIVLTQSAQAFAEQDAALNEALERAYAEAQAAATVEGN